MTGDEIAVVGIAGRFPGAADPAALWRVLLDGADTVHDYTDDELRALGIGPALLADPAHVRAGGRLDGVEDFDAAFFGFGPDEAARTDPQHRLFLEAAWSVLADAGWDPKRREGQVGVFAAAGTNRYFLFHVLPSLSGLDADDWEGRLAGPHAADYLPAQVAYRLGLNGPAVAVQTACSGSLVAVCLAAQSLLDYRCDLAIAGGAAVVWPRYRSAPGALTSPDGRCRPFDRRAAGSGYGSGVGTIALRRLADAQDDGDHVYAVLKGWAVVNDGAARPGFAVPGHDGQMAVVVEALATAGVHPDEVGMVETHGSGTPVGDAIEVAALTSAFAAAGAARPPGSCALSAVKSNVGHLDAAAGVTGLIAAVQAVRHGVIPGNPHFTAPHPTVELTAGPFFVPTAAAGWPAGPRLAGVSAFGLGGTNAHVIVAEAPAELAGRAAPAWTAPFRPVRHWIDAPGVVARD